MSMKMLRSAAAVGAAGALISLIAPLAAPAMGQLDPPGNNGTIKIDDVPFDDHPDNEPHVGEAS